MSKEKLARRDAWNVPMQIINVIIGLLIAFPIIYAFFISFMEPAQVLTGGINIIPKKWTLENYVTAFTAAPLMRFIRKYDVSHSSSHDLCCHIADIPIPDYHSR